MSGSSKDEKRAKLILVVFGYTIIMFFQNIDIIFKSVMIGSLLLVIVSLVFSCYKIYETEYTEATEICYPTMFILIGSFIAIEIYKSTPHDLVDIFREFQIHEFIFQRKLSDYGQNLAFDIFLSTVGVMFVQIFNAYHIGKKIFYNSTFYGYFEKGLFFFINILLLIFSFYIIKIGFWR